MPNDKALKPVVLTPAQLLAEEYPAIEGIYICHNTTKQQYHIGMSNNVYLMAKRVFLGECNQAVFQDYQSGDSFSVTIRPLEGSGLYSLVTLAQHYIDRYGANEDAYKLNYSTP